MVVSKAEFGSNKTTQRKENSTKNQGKFNTKCGRRCMDCVLVRSVADVRIVRRKKNA